MKTLISPKCTVELVTNWGGGEVMARRVQGPFYAKKFLLNVNTLELHDLDNEKTACQIDKIEYDHIFMFNSLLEARIALQARGRQLNGCHHCLRSEDID